MLCLEQLTGVWLCVHMSPRVWIVLEGLHLGERVSNDDEELLCCTGLGLAAATAALDTSGPASATQEQGLPDNCKELALPTRIACQQLGLDGGGAQA